MAQNKEFDNSANGDRSRPRPSTSAPTSSYGGSSGFPTGSTYKIFTLTDWLQKGHGLNEVVDGTVRPFPMSSFKASCAKVLWANRMRPRMIRRAKAVLMTVAASDEEFGERGVRRHGPEARPVRHPRRRDRDGRAPRRRAAPLDVYPSATIGTNEIAPLSMAGAIATIGANGPFCAPTIVDKVVGPDGKEAQASPRRCSKAMEPNIASTVAYALSG